MLAAFGAASAKSAHWRGGMRIVVHGQQAFGKAVRKSMDDIGFHSKTDADVRSARRDVYEVTLKRIAEELVLDPHSVRAPPDGKGRECAVIDRARDHVLASSALPIAPSGVVTAGTLAMPAPWPSRCKSGWWNK